MFQSLYFSHHCLQHVDLIHGVERDEPSSPIKVVHPSASRHKVVVMTEHEIIAIGIEARDRPELLLDISKSLSSFKLNIRNTEATVVGTRSISVWRCELAEEEHHDLEQIWSVLNLSS